MSACKKFKLCCVDGGIVAEEQTIEIEEKGSE